jgi:hypothetical protein
MLTQRREVEVIGPPELGRLGGALRAAMEGTVAAAAQTISSRNRLLRITSLLQ